MNVISISKRMFNNLEKINTDNVNTEGVIYKFDYHNKKRVFKKLFINDGVNFARKMYTLEVLSSNSKVFPDCFVMPDNLVSVDNKIVGFSYPLVEGVTLGSFLNNSNYDLKLKIKLLKEVGNILKKTDFIRMYSGLNDFYLNDIHEYNFMIDNNNKLYVIDIDGCKLSSLFLFPSRYLSENSLSRFCSKYLIDGYKNGSYINPDRNSDIYCYIIMILNFLYGSNVSKFSLEEFYSYLDYLSYIGVSNDLLNCMKKIVINGDNINPCEYLDSLNSTIVCRANSKIYKLNIK